MPRASDVKKGQVIEHAGKVWSVRDLSRSAPTARGGNTLIRLKLQAIPGGERLEATLKSDDDVAEADLVRRPSSFSYRDGEHWVFLDDEDYSQHRLHDEVIGDQAGYITDGLEGISVLLIDGAPAAIQLPQAVELEVAETAPALKGATASKSAKPATTTTGVQLMVPEYMTPGERIRVNTDTGEFMGRA